MRRGYQKEYWIKNKERLTRYRNEYNSKNRVRCRFWAKKTWLKSRYGLSLEEYDALIKEHGNRCDICHVKLIVPGPLGHARGWRTATIDHKGNKIRGVLCAQCNSGLGFFRDKSDVLINAVEYLLDREQGIRDIVGREK